MTFLRKLFPRRQKRERSAKREALYDLVWQRSIESSAEFVERHIATAMLFSDRQSILQLAGERAPKEGMALEFGVFEGRSINRLAGIMPDRHIFGFDSFEGLSEDWAGHDIKARSGHFNQGGRMPAVAPNVTLIKGWIDDTLPDFLSKNDGPIALLHIDTDTYTPCRSILTLCKERLISGSIVLFDDFLAYPGWRHGEAKALSEAMDEKDYTFLAFSEYRALITIN
jgi:hypothetical protein